MTETETETFEGWAVDRDYIEAGRIGYGQDKAGGRIAVGRLKATQVADAVRWKVLDDDGEVYYGGAVTEAWVADPDLDYTILRWAAADAGATTLLVKGGEVAKYGVDAGDGWVQVYG